MTKFNIFKLLDPSYNEMNHDQISELAHRMLQLSNHNNCMMDPMSEPFGSRLPFVNPFLPLAFDDGTDVATVGVPDNDVEMEILGLDDQSESVQYDVINPRQLEPLHNALYDRDWLLKYLFIN